MNKKDESLKAENKQLEKRLKVLEAEIRKVQPVPEFTVTEKRKRKRK